MMRATKYIYIAAALAVLMAAIVGIWIFRYSNYKGQDLSVYEIPVAGNYIVISEQPVLAKEDVDYEFLISSWNNPDFSNYFSWFNTNFAFYSHIWPRGMFLVNRDDLRDGIIPIYLSEKNLLRTNGDGESAIYNFDTNKDSVVDKSDAKSASLYLWDDRNANGSVEEAEWRPFIDETRGGSSRIDLRKGSVTVDEKPLHLRNFTPDIDRLNSKYIPAQGEIVPQGTYLDIMPILPGSGVVLDLLHAAARKPELQGKIDKFCGVSYETVFTGYYYTMEEMMHDIMFTIADVENINPLSRGIYFDARKTTYLELAHADRFRDSMGNADPVIASAQQLVKSWHLFRDQNMGRLLVQCGLKPLFGELVAYDPNRQKFFLREDFLERGGLPQATKDKIALMLATRTTKAEQDAFWAIMTTVLEGVLGKAQMGNDALLLDYLYGSFGVERPEPKEEGPPI